MLLALAVAVTVCVSPLLQGSWDLWSQSLVRVTALILAGSWLFGRISTGVLPLPPRAQLLWAGLLAALGILAAWTSPVGTLAIPETANALQGLAVLLAVPLLSSDERDWIGLGLRTAAWVLWALAFYQKFFLGDASPSSSLINPNIYAGYLLMILPLSFLWRDWALAAASFWALSWTHSLGAWASLSAALIWFGYRRMTPMFWSGIAAGFVCLILVYGKTVSPDFIHRGLWWDAALRMIADRPFLGFGPGAFAFLLPAYRVDVPGGLGSLYAHQVWLELAVGWGVPAAMIFLAAVLWCAFFGRGPVRFAILATLAHSFIDYALLVPSNFWIFCYLVGSQLPGRAGAALVRSRTKPAAILAAAAVFLFPVLFSWQFWTSDRLVARAQKALQSGDFSMARSSLDQARRLSPRSPHPLLALARLEEIAYKRTGEPRRLEAAAHWQALGTRTNPYRPASWRDLARLKTAIGDTEGGRAALEEGRRYIPHLKEPSAFSDQQSAEERSSRK